MSQRHNIDHGTGGPELPGLDPGGFSISSSAGDQRGAGERDFGGGGAAGGSPNGRSGLPAPNTLAYKNIQEFNAIAGVLEEINRQIIEPLAAWNPAEAMLTGAV